MNMKNPEVTVLMSVYNGEEYLREATDSILKQTFTDFEFLIINDGSTDRTAEILESYDDPRIKIINNEENMGLTKSLNKGLRMARGEYIARQDADDVSMLERLEKEVNFLDQNKNVGLVSTYYLIIKKNGKVLHTMKCLTEDWELKEKLLEGNPFAHGSVMLRAECIGKVGLYREEFKSAQDYDLWLRISEVYDVANIHEPLYKWRFNSKSVSVTRKKQQDKYALLAIELAKERRQFGKDRLHTLSKQEIDSFLDNFISKSVFQSRKEIAQSYYFGGTILLGGKDYRGALKLLLKSFISNPLCKGTGVLILEVLVLLLFPEPVVTVLRFVKLCLVPRQAGR
jgi:glycosyltransferase involved in cell wall biosynthesis